MPYKKLNAHFFCPAGIEEYAHFNICVGDNIIKITPYDGAIDSIQYLCRALISPPGIKFPEAALNAAGIGKLGYVEHHNETTYVMNREYDGNPEDEVFHALPPFGKINGPTEAFFAEAKEATPYPVTSKAAAKTIKLPKNLCRLFPDWNPESVSVSLFEHENAQWVEIRPGKTEYPLHKDRFNPADFYRSMSGITYRIPISKSLRIPTNFVNLWGIKDNTMYGWYSDSRKAFILEARPEHCAVCDAPIRCTNPTHKHKILSSANTDYMGNGNEIHTLVKAEKVLERAKKLQEYM